MNWSDVWKGKFQMGSYGTYVWNEDSMVLMFLTPNLVLRQEILGVLNGGEYKGKRRFAYLKQYIISDEPRELVLMIRGWGHLTGVGGLNLTPEEAARIQDEFGSYIIDKLNKSYDSKTTETTL